MRSRNDDWSPYPPTRIEELRQLVRRVSAHYLWPGLLNAVIINGVGGLSLMPMLARRWLLRAYGVRIGRRARILPGVYVSGPHLIIGDHAFINQDVLIDTSALVSIGTRVAIGPRVMVITGTHVIGRSEQRAGCVKASPVSIGDGVWIGAGAIILPGVRIEPGAVIGAGAVVVRDCAPDMLYAGTPAREVRDLSEVPGAATLPRRRWSPY